MSQGEPQVVSLGRRITQLASERRGETALVFVPLADVAGSHEVRVSWAELDRRSTQLAHRLLRAGAAAGEWVAVALRNSPEHVVAVHAIWKIGAGVLTLRWDVPAWERNRLLAVGATRLVITDSKEPFEGGVVAVPTEGLDAEPTESLPDVVPERTIAIPSGGSTGASKAVVMPFPGALVPGQAMASNWTMFRVEPARSSIVFGPLYHGNPLVVTHACLLDGMRVVLHEKFRCPQVISSIARHRPEYITFAPTMMKRLLETEGIEEVDWSCFRIILHGTAPCPPWLKRRFIDLVGAQRLWEIFASSELVGSVIVRGDEWLERPGTVGRPTETTELRVLRENGEPCDPGEVGEIYMRVKGTTAPLFEYLGDERAKVTPDGFVSVGDLGSLDEDGYLFSADRRTDLIISGGANVVPAEVEAALSEHAQVADVAVVGLADEEWGQRVHALVVPRDASAPPSSDDLEQHCRARLARYKVPRSFEVVESLERSEMFKVQRSALAAERDEARRTGSRRPLDS